MENTQLEIVNPKDFGLDENKAKTIEQSFAPKIAERDGYVQIYNQLLVAEINQATCKKAGDLRKKLVKIRTGIADIHKVEKAFYLASGRYVDALKNKYTLPVEQMEEKLSEIEKFYENQEKQRIAQIQSEREAILLTYGTENVSSLNLGTMTEDIWNNFHSGVKANFELKKEAERKAEEDRIAKEKAEAEERERIRIENEKLKAEAEAREKVLAEERKKQAEELARIEAEKKAIEEKARKEREESERKQAEEKAKQDAILRAEAEARKKAEDELKAKKEAEEKAKRDEENRIAEEKRLREEAEKKAKSAPDKEKLLSFASVLDNITLPELSTEDANKILSNSKDLLTKTTNFIREKSATL